MIKVKLLPMQFYDCISVDNRYYSCDDVKYMGATIDAVFPCFLVLVTLSSFLIWILTRFTKTGLLLWKMNGF